MKLFAPSEHQIQNDIFTYLAYKGYYVLRLNSGAVKTKTGYMRLSPKGTPDLMAFKGYSGHGGVNLLFIEVKRPGKKVSPEQEIMMDMLSTYGARCIVAYSVKDVEEII